MKRLLVFVFAIAISFVCAQSPTKYNFSNGLEFKLEEIDMRGFETYEAFKAALSNASTWIPYDAVRLESLNKTSTNLGATEGKVVFAADYYEKGEERMGYMNLRSYPLQETTQNEITNDFISILNVTLKRQISKEIIDLTGKIVKWNGTEKKILNNKIFLVSNYERENLNNKITSVFLYRYLDSNKSFTLTFAFYHPFNKEILEKIEKDILIHPMNLKNKKFISRINN